MTKRTKGAAGRYRALTTIWHLVDGRHYAPGETFSLSHEPENVVAVAALVRGGVVEPLPGTERPRLPLERVGLGLDVALVLWGGGIQTVEDLAGVSVGHLAGLCRVEVGEALAWQAAAQAAAQAAEEEGNDGADRIDGAEH